MSKDHRRKWKVLGMHKPSQVIAPATILQNSLVALTSNPESFKWLLGSPLACMLLESCRVPGHCSSHTSPVICFSSRMLLLSLPSLSQLQHSCLGSCVRADAMSEHIQLFSIVFIVSSSEHHRLLEGRGQVPSLALSSQGPSCLPSVLMALMFGKRPT